MPVLRSQRHGSEPDLVMGGLGSWERFSWIDSIEG